MYENENDNEVVLSKENNLANKSVKVGVSGTIYWAKIIGDQALVSNYDGDGKEWTLEFEPDDVSFLKEHRLLDRLKDPLAYAARLREAGKDDKAKQAEEAAAGRGDYLILRKPEFNKEGQKNKPFKVYDSDNTDWDDRLIGNGSKADVVLDIRDWGVGKKKSIYATAIRVTDLVEYESDPFAIMGKPVASAKPEPKKAKPVKAPLAELDGDDDDEIPF